MKDIMTSEDNKEEEADTNTAIEQQKLYTLSSTISNKHRISITCLILLSHALFLWGQLDILWGHNLVYVQFFSSFKVRIICTPMQEQQLSRGSR